MKMTLNELKEFAVAYVDAAKQAGSWEASHNNLYGVLDKIGKMVTLDGNFQDKLPELDGEELPLGKTIEEYFIDLTMPVDFVDLSGDAATIAQGALKPYLPSVGDVSYSYTLGRKVIPTTIPYDNVERGAIDANAAGNMIAKVTQKLTDSYSLYRYQVKKQLLGNLVEKAREEGLATSVPAIIDTTSGENFIKQVKSDIETASFANEGNCLANTLIGASYNDDLILYVKKGVMPTIEVDVEAGAFNGTKVALPVRIKVVDDFGAAEGVTAMLVDTRGVKLHRGYHAIRAQENGFSDFVNMFDHSEHTGFISKYTFVKVYDEE